MKLRFPDYFFALLFVTFLSLIGFAGFEPRTFANSKLLIRLFQISGFGVFAGILYFTVRLVLAGIKRSKKPGVKPGDRRNVS